MTKHQSPRDMSEDFDLLNELRTAIDRAVDARLTRSSLSYAERIIRRAIQQRALALSRPSPIAEPQDSDAAWLREQREHLLNAIVEDGRLLLDVKAWMVECHAWLLENDLDMKCPMQTDPLDLVERIDRSFHGDRAARLEAPIAEDALVEAFKWRIWERALELELPLVQADAEELARAALQAIHENGATHDQ